MYRLPLLRHLRRFGDNRGNVAVVVALSMAPISVATLGAVDIARGVSAKAQLQDAVDAAALGAAKSTAKTDPELQAAGARYLAQNLALDSGFRLTGSNFHFGANGKVVASASADVTPYVANLVTGGDLHIGASTEVVRADMKLEIALVLDNTGSMTEGNPTKLSRLKTAAGNFIDTMSQAAQRSVDPQAIRISLVPFSNTVRVDESAYRYSAWIDQTGASPVNDEIFTTASGTQHANRFTLFTTLGTPWRGCVESRKAPYDVQNDAPTSGATLYTPFFAVDEPDAKTSGYSASYGNNYVADGTTNTNWKVKQGLVSKYKATSGLSTTKGPNRGCGLTRMQRLTTDYASLKTQITAMVADGTTNIPIGLAWGWNMLTPTAPFSDGKAYGTDKLKKIVVLMTDGENTISDIDTPNRSTYGGTGYVWQGRILKANNSPLSASSNETDRTAALDSRLSLLCANMKTKNIEIYTIRVEVDSNPSNVLQTCATDNQHFFNVTNAADLNNAFQTIAGQIAALHISK